ncbi:MAG: hypothetical protein QOD39_2732 [Mycobacterium sp.]|jgi:hypothetical protein|nr:hypothetical protein [Mycobacterium sp.]
MMLDSLLQLDNAHAYTATAVSTNVWDTFPIQNTTRDLGAGEPLMLSILITTTVTTNVTTVFTLESSPNTSLTSSTVHWTGPSIAVATLVAGYWYAKGVILPPGNYQRYIGLRMTPATSWGAGAASAWIHKGSFDTTVYAAGSYNGL